MKKMFIYGDSSILKNYFYAVMQCGGLSHFSTDIREAEACDALLLAGGGDMHPSFYGQYNTASHHIDLKRDKDELELIRLFLQTERPILGICRGMQVLNVAFGGNLLQDIEIKNRGRHAYEEKTGDQVHLISCTKNSFLYELYGETFYVNSAHHQACQDIGDNVEYTAFSEDGIAEAMQNSQKRIYAVQFHPERMAFLHERKDTVDGRYIWEYFIKQI